MKYCGIEFSVGDFEDFSFFDGEYKHYITINANSIRQYHNNPNFAEVVDKSLNSFDGYPSYYAFRLLNLFNDDASKYKRIAGSTMFPMICEKAFKKNKKILFLGPDKKRLADAKKKFNHEKTYLLDSFELPFVEGLFEANVVDAVKEKIEIYQPNCIIILVATPKADFLAADLMDFCKKLNVNSSVNLGASMDFFLSNEKRAPAFIQKIGLEGLYRFVENPSIYRLMRWFKDFLFLKYIFKR